MYHQSRGNLVLCRVCGGTFVQQNEWRHICVAGVPLSTRCFMTHLEQRNSLNLSDCLLSSYI